MAEVEMTIRLDAALRASFLGAARTDLRSGEDVLCELMREYVNRRGVGGLRDDPNDRAPRALAVDFAWASVGLEGFTPSSEVRSHAERFTAGEIDLADFVESGLAAARGSHSA